MCSYLEVSFFLGGGGFVVESFWVGGSRFWVLIPLGSSGLACACVRVWVWPKQMKTFTIETIKQERNLYTLYATTGTRNLESQRTGVFFLVGVGIWDRFDFRVCRWFQESSSNSFFILFSFFWIRVRIRVESNGK